MEHFFAPIKVQLTYKSPISTVYCIYSADSLNHTLEYKGV